jgi:hypothetical protein
MLQYDIHYKALKLSGHWNSASYDRPVLDDGLDPPRQFGSNCAKLGQAPLGQLRRDDYPASNLR